MTKFLVSLGLAVVLASTGLHAQEISCAKDLGQKKARTLVRWCFEVSPATHPPCNSRNSCKLIVSEIQRGCGLLIGEKNRPYYCRLTDKFENP